MAKPYIIEFTIRTVVMGRDEDSAWSAAQDAFQEIARDEDPEIAVSGEIKAEKDLPHGWNVQCIPYGGDGCTRLKQLIESKEAP
jgi:hypothetical protein